MAFVGEPNGIKRWNGSEWVEFKPEPMYGAAINFLNVPKSDSDELVDFEEEMRREREMFFKGE